MTFVATAEAYRRRYPEQHVTPTAPAVADKVTQVLNSYQELHNQNALSSDAITDYFNELLGLSNELYYFANLYLPTINHPGNLPDSTIFSHIFALSNHGDTTRIKELFHITTNDIPAKFEIQTDVLRSNYVGDTFTLQYTPRAGITAQNSVIEEITVQKIHQNNLIALLTLQRRFVAEIQNGQSVYKPVITILQSITPENPSTSL
ncbi:MAG: hypothetical protein ACEQSA_04295 [Weeksellaceae bacterium]